MNRVNRGELRTEERERERLGRTGEAVPRLSVQVLTGRRVLFFVATRRRRVYASTMSQCSCPAFDTRRGADKRVFPRLRVVLLLFRGVLVCCTCQDQAEGRLSLPPVKQVPGGCDVFHIVRLYKKTIITKRRVYFTHNASLKKQCNL